MEKAWSNQLENWENQISNKKAQLDLEFLQTCKKNNVVPKFLRIKLANRKLSLSHAYNICQKRLLNQEISKSNISE